MMTEMPRGDRHTHQALSSLDTGIHFEPLEPRLLLSGSTEGVVVESRLPDEYQTNQSVVEAQILTVADEEISTAPESLSIFEQDPSTLPAVPDDLDESSLSADDTNRSDLLWIPSSEMPTFDVLKDASKDIEIEAVSDISESGSAELIEELAPSEAVSPTAVTEDTDPNADALAGLDETGSTDATDVEAILTDPEIGVLDTEEALPGEDVTPDSALILAEEESEILYGSTLSALDAVSDTADEEARNELVFVNDDVADYDQLTEDLLTEVPEGRDITVVTLDSGQDGIEQISSVLSESEDIDAVHFVSHGTDRAVKLGGTWLQDTDLDTYSDAISEWGSALTGDADLIFYGCNLAGGDRGRELLETLGELTDADVAASTDDTGHAIYGADWDLEYTDGNIETSVAFSDQLQEDWEGLLAVPVITARETIDSDGDGQIDQIKITTDQNLNDDFSGLTMTVSTYTVTGYSSNIANDAIFYVNLTESGSADTDAKPTVTVTANTTLSNNGGADKIATDAGVLATDTAAPVILAKETADLDSDGFIDAIHVTFSEAVDDTTVFANDWDVAGVAGEAFNSTTAGDTADDADIYLTFADGVMDTTETPDLTYTPDGPTDADVQDMAGISLGSTESWWNTSWQNRTQITFYNAAQAENLPEFPVLVSLTASEVDFDKIEAGGADIRFIDRTTGAGLSYQIENWDDGAETAAVWVNVPQIDGASNTDFIWMYYNNAGAADNSSTATWNADYEGVWHLNEATDAVNVDATSNTNDGTPNNSPTAATGKISGALDFSVDAQASVEIPYSSIDLSTGVNPDWTISAWVKPNADFADVDYPLIYSYGDYDASLGLNSKEGDASDDGQIETWQNDTNPTIQSTGTAVTVGSWNYVAVVHDSTDLTEGPDGTVYLYLNGAVVGSGAAVDITQAGQDSWIGWESHYQDVFKGLIDEVRVSSTVRSEDWLAAQYASMNLSFNTFGAEQSVSTVHVTTDAANDAPTITPTVADLAYTENDGAVAVDGGITVADVDDTNLESATAQITGNYVSSEDTLSFTDQNGITGTWTAATGTLTLTGSATKANYQTALQSITYTNSSDDPDTSTRTISFTINDGARDSTIGTRDITVAAKNDTPVADDTALNVAEDAANGAVVGTVTATDPDAGDTRTYSITAGNGDGIFAINSATGEITVTDNSNLNYESATSYSLTVQVEDAGGLTDTAAVTVNITDVNEVPVADDPALTVAENSANGTVVGTVTTTDPDAGDTQTYSITTGNGDGIFAINSATGEITVTDNSNLDYESATSYGLTVKVEDSGGLTDTAAVTVNVTGVNEDPTVNSASFSIDEHSADGSAVGTLTASDPDAGDSLSYSIIAGNDQGLFSIDSSTGKITVNNGTDLDFEVDPTYTLTIRVADSGSPALSKTATVTINLNDIFEAVAEKADPEPEPEEPEEAEPEDTTSDTEPEPVDDTGTNNDQNENDPSGGPINDEDPTDNDTDQEDDTETEEETDSENQTDGLPQNLPSDSRDGSNAVTRKKHNPSKRDGKARTTLKNRKESKQVAESNMEEMLLINPQGKPESRREVNLQNEVTTFSAISSEEKISAPAKAIISNRTMQRELDSINNQIDEVIKRLESRAKLIAGTAMGVSAALMGGYALWAFRGISLMASSFASLPVWQFFDPLPVLSNWEGSSEKSKVNGKYDDENIDEEEKKLQNIFDK